MSQAPDVYTNTQGNPTDEVQRRAQLADRVIAAMRVSSSRARVFSVEDPSDAQSIATLPDMEPRDALEALDHAVEAGQAWSRTSLRSRADILRAWYDNLIAHSEEIAVLISREMGKPLVEARGEVAYGSDFVRWYSEEAVRPKGDFRESPAGNAHILVRRAPVGPAVLITPWNFPLAMATRKIAPALAAGCAALVKPAALTPLTTLYAVELAVEAGVPRELVPVITTTNAPGFSEAVLGDPRVRKVSFTGSTGVGRRLMELASVNVVRSSMELGGNAPLLVFDDADLERAVDGAVAAKMRNGGQSCIAANRIYVQSGIADAFVEGLVEKLSQVVVGSGLADGVGLGPLIDSRAVNSMTHYVEDAIGLGAELRLGGSAPAGPGHFFPPTVLDAVPAECQVATSEIFGPIAAVQRVDSEEEALTRANDTDLGLAAYVFTESLDRAFRVADRLEAGIVGINQGVPSNAAAPFGGMKQSGIGREGSGEGLEEYQEIRYYSLARPN